MQATRKAAEQQMDDSQEKAEVLVPMRPVAVAREIYNDYGVGVRAEDCVVCMAITMQCRAFGRAWCLRW